jgi:hypothetical protein
MKNGTIPLGRPMRPWSPPSLSRCHRAPSCASPASALHDSAALPPPLVVCPVGQTMGPTPRARPCRTHPHHPSSAWLPSSRAPPLHYTATAGLKRHRSLPPLSLSLSPTPLLPKQTYPPPPSRRHSAICLPSPTGMPPISLKTRRHAAVDPLLSEHHPVVLLVRFFFVPHFPVPRPELQGPRLAVDGHRRPLTIDKCHCAHPFLYPLIDPPPR